MDREQYSRGHDEEQRLMTMKMMQSRRQQHGCRLESTESTMPTGRLTGCLLSQAWLTSVGSRLILTTNLGTVRHHCPLSMPLLGTIVIDPSQFVWK